MQGGAGHAPSGEGKVSSEPGRWAGESQRGEGEDLEPQPAVTGRWSAGLPPLSQPRSEAETPEAVSEKRFHLGLESQSILT